MIWGMPINYLNVETILIEVGGIVWILKDKDVLCIQVKSNTGKENLCLPYL